MESKKSILLAEDNEVNQKLFGMMITKLGHKLDLAVNGKEAVTMAAENNYDIIFMDLHMPVMDGFEATKIIKEKNPAVPVIAVTADTFENTINLCNEAGINDILKKPYKKDNVENILQKYNT